MIDICEEIHTFVFEKLSFCRLTCKSYICYILTSFFDIVVLTF